MAVVMSMHWPEVSLDQYELVRNDVRWETKVPNGAMFHVAWIAADGFRVIDLWESEEAFQRFSDSRLMPAIARHGLTGQPTVAFAPAHAIFAPNVPGSSPRASTIRRSPRAAKPRARKAAPARRAKKAVARRRKKR